MIEIKNLTKSFDEKIIFDNANININENSISCIMGTSGIGKTTLLRIIMGLDTDYKGIINGIDNKKFSAVFQEDRLITHIDAIKNIELTTNKTKSEIKKALRSLDLDEDSFNKTIKNLSGGMARRVSICRCIMANSHIIIMDEPFKGLDEKTKEITIKFLLSNIKNRTAIIVTHNIEEAKALGADIINL